MKKVIAAAVATAALSGPATAADLFTDRGFFEEAAPTSQPLWQGIYLGAHAGYGWGAADYEHQNVNFFGGPGGRYDNDIDGAVAGGHIGYNYQIDRLVLGIEGSFDWVDIGGNYDFAQYTNDTTTDLNWYANITGRVGFSVDRTLFYVKGGYAWAEVEAGQNYYSPGSERTWSDKQTVNGFVVGGGLEYAINQNLIVGVEYTYTDFGNKQFSGGDSAGVPAVIDGDLNISQVLGRVSVKY